MSVNAVRFLGAAPVAGAARLLSPAWLRAIAYHDVTDPDAFEAQLQHLREHYSLVTGEEVAKAVRGEASLPRKAVWLTFDDAHQGVMAHALPLLNRHAVPATLFVCAALIDSDEPYWWQVLDTALQHGSKIEYGGRTWSDRAVVTRLKGEGDLERRRVVAVTRGRLEDAGLSVSEQQVSSHDLDVWVAAGHEVGNHSWDHPCLDTCHPDEQRAQVLRAHKRLSRWMQRGSWAFALPNGNEAMHTDAVLRELGYDLVARFDHRLARRPDRVVSRLRLDADAPLVRARAVLSGAHSGAFGLRERFGSLQRARPAA